MASNVENQKKPGTVKFRLFKDSGKYEAPVFVAVNGKSYLIQRGVDVEIPVAVYEVLMNSENQLSEADKVMLSAVNKEYESQ